MVGAIGSRLRDAAARGPRRVPLDPAERDAISAGLYFDGCGEALPYVVRLGVLTLLSTLIAALGLIGNAPAVVIGAMLVAPLMQPILGLAGGLTNGEPRRELVSLALIAACSLEGFGAAVLVARIVPSFRVVALTPELMARTAPGLLDLGIAIAAGAAGAYVTVRRQSVGALPGAAIAVALIPPLASVGILLERGNRSLAAGALVLFLVNLLGILLAAVAVFVLTGYAGGGDASALRRRVASLTPLAVVLVLLYPLGRHSSRAFAITKDEALVRGTLVPVLQANDLGLQNLVVVHSGRRLTASVDVVGPHRPPSARTLAASLAAALHRPDVTLIVRWTRRVEDRGRTGTPN